MAEAAKVRKTPKQIAKKSKNITILSGKTFFRKLIEGCCMKTEREGESERERKTGSERIKAERGCCVFPRYFLFPRNPL